VKSCKPTLTVWWNRCFHSSPGQCFFLCTLCLLVSVCALCDIVYCFVSTFIMPPSHRVGHNALIYLLSVCLSVPRLTLSRLWKLKIGNKEVSRVTRTVTPFRGRKVKHLPGGQFLCRTACVFYRDVNVQWTISVLWPPSWKLCVAVEVITCRGRGYIVPALGSTAWPAWWLFPFWQPPCHNHCFPFYFYMFGCWAHSLS